MLRLLPAAVIAYRSQLTTEDVVTRLSMMVEPPTSRLCWRGGGTVKPYEGYIRGQTFDIRRAIAYANSSLPRIYGTIRQDRDATIISIEMKLHSWFVAFLGAVGIFLCVAAIGLTMDEIEKSGLGLSTLIPIGLVSLMALLIYVVTMAGFWIEVRRSKVDLQTIFESEPVDVSR